MGTQLTVGTMDGVESIPSLPPRLAALVGAVGSIQHPGQPVRYHLQTGWKMEEADRAEARRLLSTLDALTHPLAPFEGRDGGMVKGALITKIVKGLGGAADVADIVAGAKVENYADAIEDLPAWCIDSAIKRWNRGQCPEWIEKKPNYNFPPAPATLRKMAFLDFGPVRESAGKLRKLVNAEPMADALDPDKLPKPTSAGGREFVPALRRMP